MKKQIFPVGTYIMRKGGQLKIEGDPESPDVAQYALSSFQPAIYLVTKAKDSDGCVTVEVVLDNPTTHSIGTIMRLAAEVVSRCELASSASMAGKRLPKTPSRPSTERWEDGASARSNGTWLGWLGTGS